MKNFAIILDNKIVHKYEAEEVLIFGGPWGSEEAQHVEVNALLDIDCIKLENGQIVEDTVEKNRRAQAEINGNAMQLLNDTDYKVIRHQGQLALNIPTSLTGQQYLELEQQRQAARDSIQEI